MCRFALPRPCRPPMFIRMVGPRSGLTSCVVSLTTGCDIIDATTSPRVRGRVRSGVAPDDRGFPRLQVQRAVHPLVVTRAKRRDADLAVTRVRYLGRLVGEVHRD